MPYGFEDSQWNQAKEEGLNLLIKRIQIEDDPKISYSDFVGKLTEVDLEARDPRLSYLLEEILVFEHTQKRPLITALIVHAQDRRPGRGFFDISRKKLGFKFKSEDDFWITQYNQAIQYWKNQSSR